MFEEIIDDYKSYREVDKELFKDFLNDILKAEKWVKENKWKKFINQEEIDNNIKEVVNEWWSYLEKEWITEEDLKKIPEDFLSIDNLFWLDNSENESIVLFPVYKWENETNKNDNLYMKRLNILNILVEKWIIRKSDFNIIKEFNESDNSEDMFMRDMFAQQKKKIIDKFWESVWKRQLEWLKWRDKYIEFIIFKLKTIKKLLQLLKEAEIEEFIYRDDTLFYWWKVIYAPTKYTDREVFLNLLFSEPKLTYFKINKIYEKIEWIYIEYLSENQSKKIYNIKDKLNKKVEEKTWIKKLFSLWKWDNKGKICRSY